MAHRLRRLFSTATLNPTPQIKPKTSPSNPKNPPTLKRAINSLFHERSLDRLTQSFKISSNSHHFRSRNRIFESAIGRLSAANRQSSIVEIIDFQKQFKEDFKREGYGMKLILLYGRARMVEDAKRTFEEIGEIEGAVRTVKSFNALLTVYEENGEFGRVVDAFEKVPEGIVLDEISYNILIKAFCSKGDLDEAFKVLDLMEKNNVSPSLVSLNTLLYAFYANDRFSDADKIWKRMETSQIKPDTLSFNAKMRGLVSKGKTSEALEIVDEIKQLKLKPDTFTFNALIEGYCKDGNLEEAKKIYFNLTTNDCAPNRRTFSILIPALCEAGELDLALTLCNENITRRKFVEAKVVQDVVNKLVTESMVDDAKKLVTLAREKNGYSKKVLTMPPE